LTFSPFFCIVVHSTTHRGYRPSTQLIPI
jgi:hypothetical protein